MDNDDSIFKDFQPNNFIKGGKMNNSVLDRKYKGTITRDELHTIIIEDKLRNEQRLHEKSIKLEEDIVLAMNKYKRPATASELLLYLDFERREGCNLNRHKVKPQIDRLIRADLVVKLTKNQYWLQYEVIVSSDVFLLVFLKEETRFIEHLWSEICKTRCSFLIKKDSDFAIVLQLKLKKFKSSLLEIRKNVHVKLPEIDKALPEINRLAHLYRNPHIESFRHEEPTVSRHLERCVKELISDMNSHLLDLGG